MANKKIMVSDGSGRYQEVPSSSLSIDDNILSASNIIVSSSTYSGPTGSVMQVYDGKLIPVWTTSSLLGNLTDENGNPVIGSNLSGALFQFRTGSELGIYQGIGPSRIDSASFSGDIIGTTGSVKVISIANVINGTLDSRFGGTNAGSFDNDAIVTLGGSNLKPSNGSNNIIITDANVNWSMADKSSIDFTPLTGAVVYLFTGSVGISAAFSTVFENWSPPAGTRFIRVICQGGGGGGGGARKGTTAASTYSGGGGSGGGYSDATFNANIFINPITIVAGHGGYMGDGINIPGSNGGSSSFGDYIYSAGGLGGSGSDGGSTAGTSGGIGYLSLGGSGGKQRNSTVGTSAPNLSTVYGAPGGGGGGGSITIGNTSGYNGGSLLNLNGGVAGGTTAPYDGSNGNDSYLFYFNKYYLNGTSSANIQIGNFPKLLCTGGGGGAGVGSNTLANGGNGGSASFGAGGGGGGGKNITSPSTSYNQGMGGNGGKGYVLIICT